ncbi:MAG: formyltetrahydrofolate deformylase [Candidatus Methylomirabilis oxygeniifera]|uniref:Formyltetrahydrofolate deformylase n=1 Tax=Methylomirabilis oxygeniifera TaxID=671143 RepID=D5MIY9_METO1|nr:MAG: formyltetrahydrofolate deformylase [Candidatus Methylomirabilis oxyfera]CBE69659.1 Putative formyltetrahydrofolate deformylase (Formyl-H(4)F hydrolase) (purU) [Candidatus Methylomirabilis oxyfera]
MALNTRARLLISCPDRPGIVAAVSQCLFEQGANIVHSDQHTTDPEGGVFFVRIEFDLPELDSRGTELERVFEPIARRFRMDWRLTNAARVKPIAIFVSKEDHCLLELLWRWRAEDMAAEIAMVVSNHANLRGLVEAYGIPFYHIAVTQERQEQAEASQLQLVEGKVDLIVMARYMRVLSSAFIRRFPNRIINIHHSFLPAFVGADPYAQAHSRGVKLIGATAHYATDALDAGPIIEQDVERVDHRHTVEDLKRIGRHVERVVLARAVTWHLEDKVLVHGNKTVVFA